MSGTEVAELTAVFGLEVDEVNVVFVGHGVRFGTDGDAVGVLALAGDDGYMFLVRGVDGIGLEFLHRLATAFGGHTGVNDAQDDVPANRTAIKFSFHSCNCFLLIDIR